MPFNTLTLALDAIDEDDTAKERRAHIQQMKLAASSMMSTLNSVLSLQRIQGGKLQIEMNPVRQVMAGFGVSGT